MVWAPEQLEARVFHSFLSWAVTTGRRYKLPPGRVVALVRDLVGGPVPPGLWSAGRDATP